MSVQRRLLHWTRAVNHGSPLSKHPRLDLPAPTSPEPLGLSRDMQRVSLDPKTYPVGTTRNWNINRPSLTATPLGPNNARLTPQAVPPQVWRTVVDNPKLALRLGLTHRTPIPNTRRTPPLSIFQPNFRRSGVLCLWWHPWLLHSRRYKTPCTLWSNTIYWEPSCSRRLAPTSLVS